MKLIAEVKLRSPFGYRSTSSWETALHHATALGDIISIHTDTKRFGGPGMCGTSRPSPIALALSSTRKPILAKGVHWTDAEVDAAFAQGATFVLTVGRDTGRPGCWFEPTHAQLTRRRQQWLPQSGVVVLNRRNLATGELVDTATMGRWRAQFSPNVPIVYASGYTAADEVPTDGWGVIVGEGLRQWIAE